ncbi:MAG TPA: BTAD domain-containing putative transcriptional regulator [Methylomirabilota bacterium]|nr:BTAD domain-containing putative transcriptional regulator [Methylomirabilota bacterium]
MAKAWKSPLRLYLTGRLAAELGDKRFDERRLPGRQGRRAFAYLALERTRPVPIDELADAVWGTASPAGAWETALSAIVSKLRASLRSVDARCAVTTAAGCYQLVLPPDAWVDIEAAHRALEEAESRARAGRFREAWGPANVAGSIAARPFLAGADGDWIARARQTLRETRVRALECLAGVARANGEHPLAAQLAREVVDLEPFRETGWQELMRAYAGGGNRAQALRAYADCKKLLATELGAPPSPETDALARALRRSGA